MAVFTPFHAEDAKKLLEHYDIGNFISLTPIAAGIENTNYFLDTDQGKFVFTIFERLRVQEIPFYLELMHHLAQKQIAVPAPQLLKNGEKFSIFAEKPCAIVTCLQGSWVKDPSSAHCALMGTTLARMHLAAQDFRMRQPNLRSLDWWQKTIPTLQTFIPSALLKVLNNELAEQTAFYGTSTYQQLPKGAIHADGFRDNVLFTDANGQLELGGVIDFYFAGVDTWLFDCAVTANDWCIDRDTGVFDSTRLQSFLQAYHAVRPFTSEEQSVWSLMTRAAALRFWVSRLWDFYLPRPAETLTPHDPTHFERILFNRRSQTDTKMPL